MSYRRVSKSASVARLAFVRAGSIAALAGFGLAAVIVAPAARAETGVPDTGPIYEPPSEEAGPDSSAGDTGDSTACDTSDAPGEDSFSGGGDTGSNDASPDAGPKTTPAQGDAGCSCTLAGIDSGVGGLAEAALITAATLARRRRRRA